MAMAYVLINTEIGGEKEVMSALDNIAEVKVMYGVYGLYDIVAIIETETMERLKDTIGTRLRRLDKVRSTLIMIVVD